MKYFVTDEVFRINLEDEEWIDCRDTLAWDELNEIFSEGTTMSVVMPLLVKVIKAWSFKDSSGAPVPCNEENIRKLNFEAIRAIQPPLLEHFLPEKKSSVTSEKPSSGAVKQPPAKSEKKS